MKNLILLLGLLMAALCQAETYSIDWHKIAAGGGVSGGTNGGSVYSISGTIGQHDAGAPMGGGGYSLSGGFWSLVSVLQTSGAPELLISHSGSTVTVYWQNVSGWTLEQTASLASPSGWSASSGVTTSNGTNLLILAPAAGTAFFRLRSQ